MKAAWRLNLLDRETMEQTVDVAPARGKRELKGRAVSADEIASLFAVCSNDTNEALGARDAAILALLYGGGLRRAEAAGAMVEDLDATRGRLRLIGKGNKERDAYLPTGTLAAVLNWLEHRGTERGFLFNRITKAGAIAVEHGITAQLIYHVVCRRHLEAGVEPFTPHDLRRSFISELLDAGVDLSTVARQVGHSNVQTTARYDRRDDTAQQRGVLQLDVPFTK
jgi:integrase